MGNWLEELAGEQGADAFSVTTAAFVQPAVNANVTVAIEDTSWMAPGMSVFLPVGGYYSVVTALNATSASLKNLGGSSNAAVSATVPSNGVIAPAGVPGPAGTDSKVIRVTTVITDNVASLAVGPTANDGYSFAPNDLVALANQSNPANNKIYTWGAGGVFTAATQQPGDGALLISTQGTNHRRQVYTFDVGAIQDTGPNTGVIVGGNGTVLTTAPDPAGGTSKLIGNEGVAVASIPNDSAFHTVWSFDFVGRGYSASGGAITVLALLKAISGSKALRVRLECELFCSATPSVTAATANDILDDSGGTGDYVDAQFAVSGSVLNLQVKNLQGAAVKYSGIVGLMLIAP